MVILFCDGVGKGLDVCGIRLDVQTNVCLVNRLVFVFILRRFLMDYFLGPSFGSDGDLLLTISSYSLSALIVATLGDAFSRNRDIARLTLLIST